jgi:hypothetical protein
LSKKRGASRRISINLHGMLPARKDAQIAAPAPNPSECVLNLRLTHESARNNLSKRPINRKEVLTDSEAIAVQINDAAISQA